MAWLARSSVLIAFLPIAFCRLGYDVRPTQTNYAADQFDFEWGWSPVPTAMPNVFDKLSRRQVLAPNSTCGFISGLSTSVLTCNNGLDCGFNSGYGAIGCCSGYELVGSAYTLTSCHFFTTCYDSTAVAANCDLACQSNTFNLRCEQASQPYCITWSFTDMGYTNLGCSTLSGLTKYVAVTYDAPTTTVDTATPPSVTVTTSVATTIEIITTINPSITSPLTTTVTTSPTSPTVIYTTSATSLIPSTSSLGAPSPSATTSMSSVDSAGVPGVLTTNTASTGSSAGGGGTATVNTTASGTGGFSNSEPGGSSVSSPSNTAAIAGGAAGGVVGLAIIAGLIWFFMRRRKKNGTGPPTPEVSRHASMQYPYSPVSPNTQGPSQYGSPTQAHEVPATAAAVGGAYNYPMNHPQRDYPLGQYGQAHEISSEGTSSSRPLDHGYSNAPEVVQQGGYRGVDPTSGWYGNPNASYGTEPGYYGRPYNEMP